jgi:hypothetical protein
MTIGERPAGPAGREDDPEDAGSTGRHNVERHEESSDHGIQMDREDDTRRTAKGLEVSRKGADAIESKKQPRREGAEVLGEGREHVRAGADGE